MEDAGERRSEKLIGIGLNKQAKRYFPERWMPGGVVLTILVAWEILSSAGKVSQLFFPSPSTVVETFFRLLAGGELAPNIAATLSRVFLGFITGGLAGLILGLCMGWSRRLRTAVDPVVAAFHAVPKIALLPLIMILFGIGETSKVVVIAVAAFFPMLINAMAGVRQISPIHFEVAENYRATSIKVFTRVIFPGSLPMVLAGARLTLNVSLLLTIAIELISAQEGLGAMIWLAWETLRTEELYVGIAIAAFLGIGFNFILQRAAHYLTPWRTDL